MNCRASSGVQSMSIVTFMFEPFPSRRNGLSIYLAAHGHLRAKPGLRDFLCNTSGCIVTPQVFPGQAPGSSLLNSTLCENLAVMGRGAPRRYVRESATR